LLQELRAGAELDILTADELRGEVEGILSGYLRQPYRVRIEQGGTTNGSGALTIDNCLQARPGFQLLVNAVVIGVAGYTYAAPYNPATQGAIELIRAPGPGSSQVEHLRGYPFGGSSGGSIPAVYTSGDDRAIDLLEQEVLQVQVIGGPASTVVFIKGHGTMIPLPDIAAY
jgi:hypothetical protein